MAGIRERYNDVLKILSSCMPRLLSIVCKGRYCSILRNYMCHLLGIAIPFCILCVCVRACVCVCLTICFYSTLQDGFELPSRLSVSAADCMLALTEALAKKVSSDKLKSTSNALSRPITLVLESSTGDKKVKSASKSSEVSNLEMGLLFWDHLEELLNLVQRLVAVCSVLVLFGSNTEPAYSLFILCHFIYF